MARRIVERRIYRYHEPEPGKLIRMYYAGDSVEGPCWTSREKSALVCASQGYAELTRDSLKTAVPLHIEAKTVKIHG